LQKKIKEVSPDIYYINGIYSFWFSRIPVILARKNKASKIIVSPRGMLSKGSVNVKFFRKTIFLKLAYVLNFYKNVVFHATHTDEAQDVVRFFGNKKGIELIPNLTANTLKNLYLRNKNTNELKICYISRISPEKNIKFALEIISECKNGAITFDIYGPIYNEKYWQECCVLIENAPKHLKIHYHGSISSEQVNKVLQESHLFFLPSSGENYGHAIAESLFSGCPVLISDQTPWRNLEKYGAGFDISISNKQEFIAKIHLFLQMDQTEYAKWTNNSYTFAKKISENNDTKESYSKLFTI